ncbi:nitroreductase family protein [Candidatus Bathyarchaeota archaeon]|nr:nitroreductase family protein [Candidatus Bathyarchaeota archaeon]
MNVKTLATQRKTARRFKSDPVPREAVDYILETARQAPSGSNRQPWRFIVIDDPAVKTKVREAAEAGERGFYESLSPERATWYREKGLSWAKPHLTDAPTLLAVLGDTEAPNYVRSVWVAVGYMLLAAEERGLGAVTYTPSDPEKVREALGAPVNLSVETVMPLGYSADEKPKESRREMGELVHYDRLE